MRLPSLFGTRIERYSFINSKDTCVFKRHTTRHTGLQKTHWSLNETLVFKRHTGLQKTHQSTKDTLVFKKTHVVSSKRHTTAVLKENTQEKTKRGGSLQKTHRSKKDTTRVFKRHNAGLYRRHNAGLFKRQTGLGCHK